MKFTFGKFLLVLALAVVVWGATGCGTEPENASSRPWNSPEGYEGGVLGGMNYQHQ